MVTNSFKDLIVWQKAKLLAIKIYKLMEKFPKSELFGLTNQMRRATISISSNIAESYHRSHHREKQQFLWIAFGSGAELESQIGIAKTLFPKLDYDESETLLSEILKILNTFVSK